MLSEIRQLKREMGTIEKEQKKIEKECKKYAEKGDMVRIRLFPPRVLAPNVRLMDADNFIGDGEGHRETDCSHSCASENDEQNEEQS